MRAWRKLGLIAGAGNLPVRIASACAAGGAPILVVRIVGMADEALSAFDGAAIGLGEIGAQLAMLKAAGCDAVTFAGKVERPDFATLNLDARGALILPRVIVAARDGDDALMRVLVEEFEKEGLHVIGPEAVLGDLLCPAGILGAHAPDALALADIAKAASVAAAIGALDIGQGAVVAEGVVLAVEAQEGTDAMLQRVAALPARLRARVPLGVLVKRAKPMQERRIDLPVIGLTTVENAMAAQLAGIAIEAGGALIVDREAVLARADAAGLFIYGFTP
jgi:DUF1009 family protein